MNVRLFYWPAALVLLSIVANAQTPVIGGLCKLGSSDVQIGGKQTQFFLKCEARQGADDKAYGVWVVKSRATIDEPEPVHPKSISTRRRAPATCEQDHVARAGLSCVHGGECLQFNYDDATSYLQCDSDSRWIKRVCNTNLVFSFHHQACIGDGTGPGPGQLPARVPQNVAETAAPQMRQGVSQLCTKNASCGRETCPVNQVCIDNVCCYLPSTVLPFRRTRRQTSKRQILIVLPNPICPDGKLPLSTPNFCSLDQPCPVGYACSEARRCCKILSSSLCPGDASADGSCSKSTPCKYGYYCTAQNVCCKRSRNSECSSGRLPLDRPAFCRVTSDCPHSFQCSSSGRCCPNVVYGLPFATTAQEILCPAGDTPLGACRIDSDCPTRYWCIARVCCATPQFLRDPNKKRKSAVPEKKADLVKADFLVAKKWTPTPPPTDGGKTDAPVAEKKSSAALMQQASGYGGDLCPDGTPALAGSCQLDADCPNDFACSQNRCCGTRMCANGFRPLPTPRPCASDCPIGYECTSTGCCASDDALTCPDGQLPLSYPPSCGSDKDCPSAFACTKSRVCCESRTCDDGSPPLPDPTECSATVPCPTGYMCHPQWWFCCLDASSTKQTTTSTTPGMCPDGIMALPDRTQCNVALPCPSGYICEEELQLCCRGRQCYDGNSPLTSPSSCSNTSPCPAPYTCQVNVCCLPPDSVPPPAAMELTTAQAYEQTPNTQLTYPPAQSTTPAPYVQPNIPAATTPFVPPPATPSPYQPPPPPTLPPSPEITSPYQPPTQPPPTQPPTSQTQPPPPPVSLPNSVLVSATPSSYQPPPPPTIPPQTPQPPPAPTQSPATQAPPAPTPSGSYRPPGPGPVTVPALTTPNVPVTSASYRVCPGGAQPSPQQCSSAGGGAYGQFGNCPANYNCVNGLCCPATSSRACSDGSQPLPSPSTCDGVAQQCPATASCQNGVCCQNRNCPTGSAPLPFPASCSLLQPCPVSAECYGGVCCPRGPDLCPDGSLPLPVPASCVNDQCPYGSKCVNSLCCQEAAPAQCANGVPPLVAPSSCSSIQPCPQGSECAGSVCCPSEIAERKCPDGSDPLASPSFCSTAQDCPIDTECISTYCCAQAPSQQCPDGSFPMPSSQPCSASAPCTQGYQCASGVCCLASTCPDGSAPVSMCSQFSPCAPGYQCEDGSCCVQSEPTGRCSSGGQPVGTCASGGYQTSLPPPTPAMTPAFTFAPVLTEGPPSLTEQPPTYTIPPPVFTVPPNPYVRKRRQFGGQCQAGYVCEGSLCCPSGQQTGGCSDGSAPLSSPASCGSAGSYNGGPNGACPQGYLCENNICCQEKSSSCPDGSSPLTTPATCSASGASGTEYSSSCPAGYSCTNSVCCVQPTCPDGSPSLSRGTCSESSPCPAGSTCTSQGICCQQQVCVDGTQPLPATSCNNYNNPCPTGYTCTNNLCCGGSGACSDGGQPLANTQCGPLQQCPPGYVCEGNGQCCLGVLNTCPDGTPPLPSPSQCTGSSSCPFGFNCVGSRCCLQRICPDGSEALSSPESCQTEAQCPSGYTCSNGICCAARQCPDGSPSQTFCDGSNNCPNGRTCVGFICCNNFVQIARSPSSCSDGSQSLSRPSTCLSDEQCPITFACENRRCCPENGRCPGGRHLIPGTGRCTSFDLICGDGECFNGVCCSRTRTCPDGTPSLGECDITGRCGSAGARCVNGMCCLLTARSDPACPGGLPPLPARDCSLVSLCPSSFTCISDQCCPAQHLCPDQSAPPFTCSRAQPCESSGYQCMVSDGQGICCQRVTAGDLCADGSAPLPSLTGLTCSRFLPCPDGHVCERGGKCCKIKEQRIPFPSFDPITTTTTTTNTPNNGCPNGDPPLPTLSGSRCGDELLCPPRFDCINGDCCERTGSSTANQRSRNNPFADQFGAPPSLTPRFLNNNGFNRLTVQSRLPTTSLWQSSTTVLPRTLPTTFVSLSSTTWRETSTNSATQIPTKNSAATTVANSAVRTATSASVFEPNNFANPTLTVPRSRTFIGPGGHLRVLTAQDAASVLLWSPPPCEDGSEVLDSVINCSHTGCPFGYQCVKGGCCHAKCTDGSSPLIRPKTCDSDVDCRSPGFFCDNHVCCRQVGALHSTNNLILTNAALPVFRSTLENFDVSRRITARACLDSSRPLGGCRSTLECPANYVCENSVCCRSAAQCPFGTTLLPGYRCDPTKKWCPPNFSCIAGNCCGNRRTIASDSQTCPDSSSPLSRPSYCDQDDACPVNFYCWKTIRKCCSRLSSQYVTNAGGMVCTFNECSASNPCPPGAECNNGYCCEATNYLPAPATAPQPVIQPASQPIIRSCPSGATPMQGDCQSDSECPDGFYCPRSIGLCCQIVIRNCPDNTPSLQQACVTDSQCPSGYSCPIDVGACCKITVTFALPSTDTRAIPVPVQLPAMSAFPTRRNQYIGKQEANTTTTVESSKGNATEGNSTGRFATATRDWPYAEDNFDLSKKMTALDRMLIRATGDGMRCAGGFTSSLRCGFDTECPTGLFCDVTIALCCPLLLPLSEVDQHMYERSANHMQQPSNYNNYAPSPSPSVYSFPDPAYGSYPSPAPSPEYGQAQPQPSSFSSQEYSQQGRQPSSFSSQEYGQQGQQPSSFEASSSLGGGSSLTSAYGTAPAGESAPSTSSSAYDLSGSPAYGSAPSYGTSSNSAYPSPASSYPSPASSYPSSGTVYGSAPAPFGGLAPSVSPYDYTSGYGSAPQSPSSQYELTSESASEQLESQSERERKRYPYPYSSYSSQYSSNPFSAYPTGTGGCNGCGVQSIGSSCNGCGGQSILPVAAPIAVSQASSCTSGCPRGYSGCCGTQQASCCQIQSCPGGAQSTGRSCYTSCPTGQTCNSGVCCPSLSCPGGSQPIGSCSNGFCGQGYQCVRPVGVCCVMIQPVLTCPSGAQAVGQCINGQCGTGYSCDLSTNLCCPSVSMSNNFICTDGSQAAGACINGLCGAGFSCVNNLCCRGASTTLRCLDGTTPLGTCLNGLCPLNYQCSLGNICCGTGTALSCPSGGTAIGPCTSNLCPVNYVCNTANNQCCPSTVSATCPTGVTPLGPCVGGQCPLGYDCNTLSNQCCQSATPVGGCPVGSTSIGPCVAGLCPPGNTCVSNLCCSTGTGTGATTCPAGIPSVGPCVGGLCPPGNTCVGGTICCTTGRLHRAPAIESAPDSLRRQQPIVDQIGSCPNGQQAIGQCIGGLCGAGFTCVNNLCCSTTTTGNSINLCPNGQSGVGACFPGGTCGIGFNCDTRTNLCCSPSNGLVGGNSVVITVCQGGSQPLGTCPTGQNTCPSGYACEGTICCRMGGFADSVNVGGQCQQPQQCSGYTQGLATCVDQTCRCQPVAYAQGVACVRRKMLRLKFNDDGKIDSAEEEEVTEESETKTEKTS